MIDGTIPTPETSTETPRKKKRNRSPVGMRQSQLRELTKTEQICMAATKTVYAVKLAARAISAIFVGQLKTDAAAAREKCADTTQSGTSRQSATANEAQAGRDLIKALQEVQAAARQKYAATNPLAMRDYFVGLKLNGTRANLEQTSAAILEKLDDDTLPGITDEKKEALGEFRENWIGANTVQSDEGVETKTGLNERDVMLESIKARRQQIQFAVDAEWPYQDKANEAVRREFYLPLTRPFTVRNGSSS